MADIAGRDSTKLHTLLFFKGKTFVEEGRVIKLHSNGFTVLVPRFGIEGVVIVASSSLVNNEQVTWQYDKNVIKSSDGKHTIKIFDRVTVQLYLDESLRHSAKLVYLCINPPIHHEVTQLSYTESSAKRLREVTEQVLAAKQDPSREPPQKRQKTT